MTLEGDPWEPEDELVCSVHQICSELCRVLKYQKDLSSNQMIQISFAQPHFRTKYLSGYYYKLLLERRKNPPVIEYQEENSDELEDTEEDEDIKAQPPKICYQYGPIIGKSEVYPWELSYLPIPIHLSGFEYFVYRTVKRM